MPNVTTKITTLEVEVEDLKRQLALLADLLESLGLQSWLDPAKAAAFLGVSRDSLCARYPSSRGTAAGGQKI